MNVLAITQARMGSSRLPGKVLKTVSGETLLEIHLKRILKSKHIDQLLVATTVNAEDDAIVDLVTKLHVPVYRGSVADVLNRFYQAAMPHNPTWVVRLTSDCPLIDAQIIDAVIEKAVKEDLDYCSNTLHPTFPNGMDVEVFKMQALVKAKQEASLNSDKEHVTPYIYRNSTFFKQSVFKSGNYSNPVDYEKVRLTIDEPADLEVFKILIGKLGTEKNWKEYTDFYLSNKEIQTLNGHFDRNEGYNKSLKNDKQ